MHFIVWGFVMKKDRWQSTMQSGMRGLQFPMGWRFVTTFPMALMNLIIKGKHKKTLIFPVFSGDSVLYSDSCLVVIWVL